MWLCFQIRKQAIKELPGFCKGMPEHLPRIADIMTQLLQSEDQGELAVVQQALTQLFKINAKGRNHSWLFQKSLIDRFWWGI